MVYGPPAGPVTATFPASPGIELRLFCTEPETPVPPLAGKFVALTVFTAEPAVPAPIGLNATVALRPVRAPRNVISNCSTIPTPPGPALTATFPFRAGTEFSTFKRPVTVAPVAGIGPVVEPLIVRVKLPALFVPALVTETRVV